MLGTAITYKHLLFWSHSPRTQVQLTKYGLPVGVLRGTLSIDFGDDTTKDAEQASPSTDGPSRVASVQQPSGGDSPESTEDEEDDVQGTSCVEREDRGARGEAGERVCESTTDGLNFSLAQPAPGAPAEPDAPSAKPPVSAPSPDEMSGAAEGGAEGRRVRLAARRAPKRQPSEGD